MEGRVDRIPEGKHFGFIIVEGQKKDYFFHRDDFVGHWADLVHDVNTKQRVIVNFTPEVGQKGPRGIRVNRLDHPNQASIEEGDE